jgi:hypothetical protein
VPQVAESYEQLLDDPRVEVLDIAVPPHAQLALIQGACRRRTVKGILAQKPLGMNYREALEAVHACAEAGIALAVNQNMRYDQSVRAAHSLLQQGVLGEPVLATIDMRGIPPWRPWHQELRWLTLRIMSIHHLDAFRFWFGDPERVFCSLRTDPRTTFPHTDGICLYILEYANGLRCAAIDDTWTGPAREGCPGDLRIQWRIEGLEGLALGDLGWCKDPCTTPSTLRYAVRGDREFHQPNWTESWFPDAFIGTMAQLLCALETGTEPPLSGRDNLETMALVEAAYLSAAESRSVGVEEVRRREELSSQSLLHRGTEFFGRLFTKPHLKPEPMAAESLGSLTSNLTPRAMQLLALARKEAIGLHHNFVGTEHLLLGLMRLGQGTAVQVLGKRGIDMEKVGAEVNRQVGVGVDHTFFGNVPYTPRVKRVLVLAAKEAKALQHGYVGTEHILLGLLSEEGVAARVLRGLGLDPAQTRQDVLHQLKASPPAGADSATASPGADQPAP